MSVLCVCHGDLEIPGILLRPLDLFKHTMKSRTCSQIISMESQIICLQKNIPKSYTTTSGKKYGRDSPLAFFVVPNSALSQKIKHQFRLINLPEIPPSAKLNKFDSELKFPVPDSGLQLTDCRHNALPSQ